MRTALRDRTSVTASVIRSGESYCEERAVPCAFSIDRPMAGAADMISREHLHKRVCGLSFYSAHLPFTVDLPSQGARCPLP